MNCFKVRLFFIYCLFMASTFWSCKQEQNAADENSQKTYEEGFNLEGSDKKAIDLADQVMEAIGGHKNWSDTRYLAWNFFGNRKLYWDKWEGDVRLEYPSIAATILVNINSGEGKVSKDGFEFTQKDSLNKYLELGKTIWINDSYWLFMPFKLKDSGVTLKYIGKDTTLAGEQAEVLQLTFKDVGKSPDHKYHVFVDKNSNLISQWSFFNHADDQKPVFSTEWSNYQPYGNILLSDNRGKGRQLTEIAVYSDLPENVFNSPEPIDSSILEKFKAKPGEKKK